MIFLGVLGLIAAACMATWLWRWLAEGRLAANPALWQADWPFQTHVRLVRRHLARHGWKILPRLGRYGHIFVRAEKPGLQLNLRLQNTHTTGLQIMIQDTIHANATDDIAVGIVATDRITEEHRALATHGNVYVIAPTELAEVDAPARAALAVLRKRRQGQAAAKAASTVGG